MYCWWKHCLRCIGIGLAVLLVLTNFETTVSSASSYFYDNNGLLSSVTELSGGQVTFEYDNNGNVLRRLSQQDLLSITDDLNDWSKTYSHTSNLYLDWASPEYFAGDPFRAARGTATNEEIVWKQVGMKSFQAVTYYVTETVYPFSLYTSSDGVNWTLTNPTVTMGDTAFSWTKYTYALTNLSAVNYVKIRWNNLTGNAWSPQN
jgi:YD repeat-containing protein